MPKWVKEEVSSWITSLEDFSGQPIRHSASILEYYVCSYSGKCQIGGRVSWKGAEKREKRFQVTLNECETNASSTYRELRFIESGLTLIGPEARVCVVKYGHDNYA